MQHERQRLVDAFFANDIPFWQEVYDRPDFQATKYVERRAAALKMVDDLELTANSRVMDLGCGAGQVALALADRSFHVHAVDAVPEMVAVTKANGEAAGLNGRLTCQVADAHGLPYPDATFALVVGLGLLPWLHSPGKALLEIHRTLQPGGYLIASTENLWRLDDVLDPVRSPWFRGARGWITGRAARPLRRAAPTLHSPNATVQLLAGAGFEPIAIHGIQFGPFTLLNRPVFSDRRSKAISAALQRLADGRWHWLQKFAVQFIFVARRRDRG